MYFEFYSRCFFVKMTSLRNELSSLLKSAGATIKSSNDESTGSTKPNIKSLIPNKEHLAKVIESYYNGTSLVDFAWEKQMEANKFDLSAFEVEGLGEIKVPVSLEVE